MKYVLEIFGSIITVVGLLWAAFTLLAGGYAAPDVGIQLATRIAFATPGLACFLAGLLLLGMAGIIEAVDRVNATGRATNQLLHRLAGDPLD